MSTAEGQATLISVPFKPFAGVLHEEFVDSYLDRFGYLQGDGVENKGDAIHAAIVRFQEFNGLKPDGILGPKTAHVMLLPRCGVPENLTNQANALWKWKKNKISYYIHPDLHEVWKFNKAEFDAVMADAFEYQWCQHSNLDCVRTYQKDSGDINVYGKRIDGPSSILAQCELPVDGVSPCRMDIDTSETYIIKVVPGLRGFTPPLAPVVEHELGHGFGLPHSRLKTALMAPTLSEIPHPTGEDDIPRFQARYSSGKPRTNPLPKPGDTGGTDTGTPSGGADGGGTSPPPATPPTKPTGFPVIEKIAITASGITKEYKLKG